MENVAMGHKYLLVACAIDDVFVSFFLQFATVIQHLKWKQKVVAEVDFSQIFQNLSMVKTIQD